MSQPSVLIVEDEHRLADLYEERLSDDYETSAAYTGEAAIEIIDERGESFDVVLLDRLLPNQSGDEVLAEIRDRGLDCAAAMVTAVDPDYDIIQMGFDGYLTKPVTEQELRRTVERLVSQQSYDQQVREHLSLLSKKRALEREKSTDELDGSEEYSRLKQSIVDSRDRLDTALAGDVFVELLLDETGDRLYAVVQYDADGWSYRYLGDGIETALTEMNPDMDDIIEQFRTEGRQKARLDETYEMGGYLCSLHLFSSVVVVHFSQSDTDGVLCAFDTDAASHLTDFVSLVRPYLEQTVPSQ